MENRLVGAREGDKGIKQHGRGPCGGGIVYVLMEFMSLFLVEISNYIVLQMLPIRESGPEVCLYYFLKSTIISK
jgi:hypothetical protein